MEILGEITYFVLTSAASDAVCAEAVCEAVIFQLGES